MGEGRREAVGHSSRSLWEKIILNSRLYKFFFTGLKIPVFTLQSSHNDHLDTFPFTPTTTTEPLVLQVQLYQWKTSISDWSPVNTMQVVSSEQSEHTLTDTTATRPRLRVLVRQLCKADDRRGIKRYEHLCNGIYLPLSCQVSP